MLKERYSDIFAKTFFIGLVHSLRLDIIQFENFSLSLVNKQQLLSKIHYIL